MRPNNKAANKNQGVSLAKPLKTTLKRTTSSAHRLFVLLSLRPAAHD
jgi:hypothetical protein